MSELVAAPQTVVVSSCETRKILFPQNRNRWSSQLSLDNRTASLG